MKKYRKFLKDLQTSEQFYNDQESRQIIGELMALIDEGFNSQPKADWIPFNEPPKEDDTYIVAWLPKGMDSIARTPHYYALWDFANDEWEVDVPESYKNFEIIGIAWQPLPEPYKAGDTNDST